MIYPGTDLKYRITSTLEGFSLDEDNFTVTIKNRWGQVISEIKKDDCFQDSEDRWYFGLENVRNGVYYANFAAEVYDDDYDKLCRIITDEQLLVSVGTCGCHTAVSCECESEHKVQYEQVWIVNGSTGMYLADKDGNPILTSDGRKIYFTSGESTAKDYRLNMTSEEFGELVEGRNENGHIDTIPEMQDALRNMGEGTSYAPMETADVDDMMARILGNKNTEQR